LIVCFPVLFPKRLLEVA